jgi:two-component system, NarL family, response regulator EvgA
MAMTFLIVDDHSPMRGVLREFLQLAYPQVAILEAACAASASELVTGHSLQLVLLDIGLPDASGIELIPRIRASLPTCGVVVVSHHSAPAYRERAMAAGANAYVTKDRLWSDLLPALVGTLDVARK